tara:strand:+ start:1076 stop:1495 length:420 start_codon:yes stop_codon:yes gene_type:complete
MERYLYFRANSAVAQDDDETNGSKIYPVSAFRGMVAGTASALGVVTDDADAFSMFFTPMGHIAAGGAADTDDAAADNVDVIVVAITTDNNQKAVMAKVIAAMNSTQPHDGFVEIFDAVTGNKVDGDIEGITAIHSVAAD